MGCIEISEHFTALCGGDFIILFDHRNLETQVLDVETQIEKYIISKKNGDSKPIGNSSCEIQIVAAKASSDGQYLAAACEGKVVVVWCSQTWNVVAVHSLNKRPMALAITLDSSTIIVADKTGDVYEFPLKNTPRRKDNTDASSEEPTCGIGEDAEPRPLLGHLSMLLDVALSEDNKFIITADRDEKIRVSHFPQAYDIHTFCLGHTEFVTEVVPLPGTTHHLLSCSGDGTLRLWDYFHSKCLCCLDTRQHTQHTPDLLQHYNNNIKEKLRNSEMMRKSLPDYPAVRKLSVWRKGNGKYLVAVTMDQVPAAFVYKIDDHQLSYVATRSLDSIPLAVAWTHTGELILVVDDLDDVAPVAVYTLSTDNVLEPVGDHPLVEIGRKYKEYFEGWDDTLDLDVLYKQRFDNVAEYLKKKEERLAGEKAAEEGLAPVVKKGRWSK
ncbi:hypothetical protein Pcinc_027414 [Petrolisthes cinctipes]|uniref:tRNA (guanine-N(7)-)-methyltransferase non-catalytic subunit n=1 Tax=Petrolisthes cinctipes TaxID=88211 RepID=A0AAE1KAV3_PETCI|nr:hypothetical protein Pcinc_027414 [Petrolisthes cinctipes]